MSLTILQVAFPFAPAGPDAVGGAEQILSQIDSALTHAGQHSIVIACDGSQIEGTWIGMPRTPGLIDDDARRHIHRQVRSAIADALKRWPVDIIHFHGVDCHAYIPDTPIPALVTLHCPVSFYNPALFKIRRNHLHLHCVSPWQRRTCPPGSNYLPEIPNGVPRHLTLLRHAKRRFALAMGRICPEKNFHAALEAAKGAQCPLLLAGEVFPYSEHETYYREQIVPRLDTLRRYIGPVGAVKKQRLLAAARCLLLPSLAEETSSLVSMESLACGTPVIAYPSGALPDIIEHGKTGFLVRNPREMAEAVDAADLIDPDYCRTVARERFSSERMISAYFDVYRQLACEHA